MNSAGLQEMKGQIYGFVRDSLTQTNTRKLSVDKQLLNLGVQTIWSNTDTAYIQIVLNVACRQKELRLQLCTISEMMLVHPVGIHSEAKHIAE